MKTHLDQSAAVCPATRVRPFADDDYEHLIAIHNRCYPDAPLSVEEVRYRDASWDHTRFFKTRLVAEDSAGRVVGVGRASHVRDEYHPGQYALDIMVDPACHGRGVGTALYEALTAAVAARGAIALRASVYRETMQESTTFLTRRGFAEIERGWELRLDVRTFNLAQVVDGGASVAGRGITLTTLAAEGTRDPGAVRRAYEMAVACDLDIPSVNPATETPYDKFLAEVVHSPNALLDGHFLALDGQRFVGTSVVFSALAQPGVLHQGLTGVLRDYRGKGIATALKLQTIAYARAHGYREIRTWNHAGNAAMLRINQALGFVKQPAWIGFEKRLQSPGPDAVSGAAGRQRVMRRRDDPVG